MTEKNQQEKMAAERQVELFTHAFEKAKDNGGVWLDNKGRKAPQPVRKHHFFNVLQRIEPLLRLHLSPFKSI